MARLCYCQDVNCNCEDEATSFDTQTHADHFAEMESSNVTLNLTSEFKTAAPKYKVQL